MKIVLSVIVLILSFVGGAGAQSSGLGKAIRIGILNDRSGPYADATGEGSAIAARMAATEFGNKIDGVPIEILVGDHMNKPDIGSSIARRWFDLEGVEVIADITNSGVGLAVTGLAKDRSKIVLNNSGSSDFTGKDCTPNSVQWNFNTYAVAKTLVTPLVKDKVDSWFIIGVDYAYGRALAASLRQVIEGGGGKVVGEVLAPINTPDFSSFLLQAKASGAKVIALANAGNDLTTAVKQAVEFNITKNQMLVLAYSINLTEVVAMGLELSQGLLTTTAFQWTKSAATRQWAKQFAEQAGKLPSSTQAAVYSQVRHYLKAVAASHTVETRTVMAKMRELPVNDAYTENGRLREDGQMIHDQLLVRVKKPAESIEHGDYLSIVETVKGDQAYQPLSESVCPLVAKKAGN